MKSLCLSLALAALTFTGCATYHASASAARTDVGAGAGIEIGGMQRADRHGPGVFFSAEASEGDGGDGDPFLTTTAHGRFSWRLDDSSKTVIPFVTLGAGAGWAWPYENAVIAEAFAEAGVEFRTDRIGFALSLRERPQAFITSSTSSQGHNTLALTLTLVGIASPTP